MCIHTRSRAPQQHAIHRRCARVFCAVRRARTQICASIRSSGSKGSGGGGGDGNSASGPHTNPLVLVVCSIFSYLPRPTSHCYRHRRRLGSPLSPCQSWRSRCGGGGGGDETRGEEEQMSRNCKLTAERCSAGSCSCFWLVAVARSCCCSS